MAAVRRDVLVPTSELVDRFSTIAALCTHMACQIPVQGAEPRFAIRENTTPLQTVCLRYGTMYVGAMDDLILRQEHWISTNRIALIATAYRYGGVPFQRHLYLKSVSRFFGQDLIFWGRQFRTYVYIIHDRADPYRLKSSDTVEAKGLT